MVPDVWSYPCLFRSSSPTRERKAENTKPLNGHKEVFIDLSRAPPRFHETVISEESEEEHMAKADWKTLDQNFVKRKDLGPQNDQHGDETGAISIEQYDTPELVTSQDDEHLLEEASAVSKDVTEDTESVNSEMPSEISNGGETFSGKEEVTASGEQGRASLENSWKENIETNSTDTGAPDQDDLISELLLVEELVQNERASTIECDINEVKENSTLAEKDSLSSISTDGSDSWVALKVENEELKTQANSVVDEQNGIDFELDAPGQLSSENVVGSFEQAKGEVDTSVHVDSVAFTHAGAEHAGVVINNAHEQSSPQEEGSSDSQPTVSDEQTNLHLARQHDPFITMDPFLDRSPTPSLSDLGYDETKFNNMEIELVEYVEGWTTLEGSDGQESKPSLTEKRPYLEIKGDDPNNNRSKDLQLTGYPDFNSDTTSIPDDVHEFKKVLLSDMMSEGFAESRETETASEMSEDESLWSTFPQFFHPSRRVKYSGNNQGVLLLAEEDQNDSDALDFTETVQDFALVRLNEFHSKGDLQQVNSNDFVDTGPRQKEAFDEKDLEEFSTASSESFECTYEVNAEFSSEGEMMCGDDDYGHLKEKKEVEKQEIPEHEDESTDLPLDVYLVSSDTTVSDKRDVCVDTCSNLDTEGLKVDEPTQLFSFQKTGSFSPCHGMYLTEKKNIADTRIGVSSEKPTTPPELSPPTIGNGTSGNNEIVSQGFRSSSESGNEVNHVWNDLDRSYSPSNWIIPSPPTPTAELQEHDIPIVSPPPIHRTASEDELDEEFKNLILPPPPSLTDTFQAISNIRIVPPPPPPTVDINHNEVGDLMYDYDEIRFLSLTDDHKLAHNNGCVSNFTGDKKIQDQNFATDASSVSMDKDSTSKSVTIPHRHGITNRTETNLKQNSTRYVPVGRFIDSDTSLSGLSTSQGSRSTWQQFVKLEGVFQEFPNTEAASSPDFSNVGENRDRNIRPHGVTELNPAISSADQENVSFDSRSRSTLKQKPFVPAKTWAARTAKSATLEDRAEESSTTPRKGVRASTSDSSLDMIEGNKKTIASTANTHEKSLNPELAEAGLSTLRSQPQYWDTLKDSSNNPPSIAGTPSQLNAPNSSMTGVKEPELRESANSSNLSAEPFMEFASVSAITPDNTRLPETFKGKISQEPEALRPVLSNIDKQETLSSYQVGYSPSTAAEDILVRDEFNTKNKHRGIGRRLSFTYRSAYVPAPYSPTRSPTQSLYTTQSSVENVLVPSFYTSRMSPVEPAVTHSGTQGTYSQLPCNTKPCLIPTSLPVVTSSSIENNADYPVNNALFCLQRPLLTRLHRDSDGGPTLNPDKDDNYRVLPEKSSGSSNFQFSTDLSDSKSTKKECSHTIELHKDVCTNASPSSSPPPLPDSSPPPLPGTSPPKMIPVFDDNDFDFGEPLTDSYQDNAQNESPERTPLDIPSSAKDLKSRRSSASVSRQRENSSDYIYGMEGKDYSRNSLSRSLTLTSFSQGINRQSSNENTPSYENSSKTGRSNSDDITDTTSFHSMDGVETKSLGIKCFNVCEESLLKASGFRKRLEVHLNGSASRVNISNETKNWPLVLQNNARFLACDVKVISSSIKRGGAQLLAAIRASLDSLEKLVESCEKASETLSKSSTDNVCTLVSMVIEVLEHYCDVITTVKTASVERPDDQNVVALVEKTSAMSLLITSLIRTLRKY